MKYPVFVTACLFSLLSQAGSAYCGAQDSATPPAENPKPAEVPSEAEPKPAEKVAVKPTVRDDEIERRLTDILEATTWFRAPLVAVEEGVVFITGFTRTEAYKSWASDLAMNTQDVVAVVNRIQVDQPPIFDLSGIVEQLREMGRSVVLGLPFLLFSIFMIPAAWISARLARKLSARFFEQSISSELLRDVASRSIGFLVFFIGIYLVLKVSGLSRLAVTVLGSTGVAGLAVGIAFREITENFLASIYLSINKPFRIGDYIAVADRSGYVQGLTARTTILMTTEGNHLQIPNAIVFKNVIRNFTSNPLQRMDFTLALDFGTRISDAQEVAMRVLRDHPAVLEDPEPLVLVNDIDEIGIRLRSYFWVDCIEHSWPKVRSSVIRLTRSAFRDKGIRFAGEIEAPEPGRPATPAESSLPLAQPSPVPAPEPVVSPSEGSLSSDADSIEEQTLRARVPEEGQNLLEPESTKAKARESESKS
ncbi:mechanosensitive ion channel [bacterium]|nr:mechanosensitive ion channel [bacterium]